MPDADDSRDTHQYHFDKPQKTEGFFLKGAGSLDWGMKNRLARIFNPDSGRTVMLAIDHGYFQGPTTGLERIDLSILPLVPYADTLMLTRGILRSVIPASDAEIHRPPRFGRHEHPQGALQRGARRGHRGRRSGSTSAPWRSRSSSAASTSASPSST